MIHEVQDFVPRGELALLITGCLSRATYPSKLNPEKHPAVFETVETIFDETGATANFLFPGLGPLVPETVVLSRLTIGEKHAAHADNCRLMEGKWMPNHTPQRVVSAMLYLNDGFEGGELVFESGAVIKPKPGLLVVFPSDQHHVHSVNRVTKGGRFNMSMWFKKEGERGVSK
jgi:predicted 2-oxoglutarate/Fe(II)-dependent dioxygenase YbiX